MVSHYPHCAWCCPLLLSVFSKVTFHFSSPAGRISSNGLRISIQTASGPLLVISIGLRHLFQWSGRFKLFKSGVRVTIYVPRVGYWAFVVTQLFQIVVARQKYQQRVRAITRDHREYLNSDSKRFHGLDT